MFNTGFVSFSLLYPYVSLSRSLRRIAEEVASANAVLVESRRARLRQVLEAEHEQYTRELAAKGLAIYN